MSEYTIGEGDGTRIAIVQQSAKDTIATSPTWDVQRLDRFNIQAEQTFVDSEEFNSDRDNRGGFLTQAMGRGQMSGPLIFGESDKLLAAGMHGAWATNALSIGTAANLYAIERMIDLGTTDDYLRFWNSRVNRMELNFPASGKSTLTLDWVANRFATGAGAISGSTYPAQSLTKPPATVECISNVAWSGFGDSLTPIVQNVKITIDHGLEPRATWDSVNPLNFRRGGAVVTWEIDAYMDTHAMYAAALARDVCAFGFRVLSAPGASTYYYFQSLEIEWQRPETTEVRTRSDIMVKLIGRARKNSTATSLKITRVVA